MAGRKPGHWLCLLNPELGPSHAHFQAPPHPHPQPTDGMGNYGPGKRGSAHSASGGSTSVPDSRKFVFCILLYFPWIFPTDVLSLTSSSPWITAHGFIIFRNRNRFLPSDPSMKTKIALESWLHFRARFAHQAHLHVCSIVRCPLVFWEPPLAPGSVL